MACLKCFGLFSLTTRVDEGCMRIGTVCLSLVSLFVCYKHYTKPTLLNFMKIKLKTELS